MNKPVVRKLRCAVYTRKSSEEGLEQDFNSLDTQREACEAYIASQTAEGWVLVPDRYDDGGFSGGTLERPALKRLLADIEARCIDIAVVYKIDRLSRSLMDFAKLVEVFDRNSVTFVSVTQSFNTTTSMGRLTLNILFSFAQFERELTGERIRDKFAASRKKGMWMGGWAPLGYDIRDRKLVINAREAAHVRFIFERFARIGSVTKLIPILAAEGIKAKSGKPVEKGYLYRIISNPVYVGEARHKGTCYPGEHQAIIDRALWQRVHDILKESPRKRAAHSRARTPALLKGLEPGPVSRIPAGDVERMVVDQLRAILRAPEIVLRTWRKARQKIGNLTETEVREAIEELYPLWDELFPAEQARIVGLLVERVDVQEDAVEIRFRVDGLRSLVDDFKGQEAA
jgi:site-specific DNA recombinase